MASSNRVYAARLARMLVLGPFGESVGRVRDLVVSLSIVRQQPRVLGLVVELPTRRRIFVPILRVASIEPNASAIVRPPADLSRGSPPSKSSRSQSDPIACASGQSVGASSLTRTR